MSEPVKLSWKRFPVPDPEKGWKGLKANLSPNDLAFVKNPRAVYVIRLLRPFSLHYGQGAHSPVAYIGKGDFQTRITSHLKGWVGKLCKDVKALKIEFYICLPKKSGVKGGVFGDIEADLIGYFKEKNGCIPLRNRRHEFSKRYHEYNMKEVWRAIGPGKGRGYHWALVPIGSNHLNRD